MRTADCFTGTTGIIRRGFLAGFLGAALLLGAGPALHAESVEELQAQLAREEKAAPESLNAAAVLGRLADAHRKAGEFDKAEPLYERALGIYEKQGGAEALGVAAMANNLAQVHTARKQYDKAESLYQRALAICEKAQPDHADTATVANNLAMLYRQQNKLDQAEPMYRRALTIREKALGADAPETAATVRGLADLYKAQGEDGQIAKLRFDYPNAMDAVERQQEPDGETVVAGTAEDDAAEAAEDDATGAAEDDAAEADVAAEETGDAAVPGEDEGVEENDGTAPAEEQDADAASEEAWDAESGN